MNDENFMAIALEQARQAAALGEVPVGAVVVWQGEIIATGKNSPVHRHDPTAHAEILALRSAAQVLGNYRLAECELFVTVEPCAMCSGAILNARVRRVVFGAAEPKTGAAGSVVNLFAQPQLNHQTQLLGGVLAQPSRSLMQKFFRQRRADQRALALEQNPLRDDSLRTPDTAFQTLSDCPWVSRYLNDLIALNGLRMHYLDEQSISVESCANPGALTYLCLHSHLRWSYQFRSCFTDLLQAGHRIIAPDLIGFGKSDKPKKTAFHTLERHCEILWELVEKLDLQNIVLVLPRPNDPICLAGMMLPMRAPQRYCGLLSVDPDEKLSGSGMSMKSGLHVWSLTLKSLNKQKVADIPNNDLNVQTDNKETKAWTAPFPEKSFCAGLRAFRAVSNFMNSAGSNGLKNEAEEFWREQFKR